MIIVENFCQNLKVLTLVKSFVKDSSQKNCNCKTVQPLALWKDQGLCHLSSATYTTQKFSVFKFTEEVNFLIYGKLLVIQFSYMDKCLSYSFNTFLYIWICMELNGKKFSSTWAGSDTHGLLGLIFWSYLSCPCFVFENQWLISQTVVTYFRKK